MGSENLTGATEPLREGVHEAGGPRWLSEGKDKESSSKP